VHAHAPLLAQLTNKVHHEHAVSQGHQTKHWRAERRVFHRANQAAERRAQETSGTSYDLRNQGGRDK